MRRIHRWDRCGERALLAALAAVIVLLGGCDALVPPPEPNTPSGNFDALWQEFDARYALFGVRHVDWDSLYVVYRPRVHDEMDDVDLFLVMRDLLAPLNDSHVFLDAPGVGWFNSGPYWYSAYFPDSDPISYHANLIGQRRLISARYLGGGSAVPDFAPLRAAYTGQRRLDYLGIPGFKKDDPVAWDQIRARLSRPPECDGLIIDVRGNPGGSSERAEYVAGTLLDRTVVYGTEERRDGPGRDELCSPRVLSVDPLDAGWASVPVVVLVDPFTGSAAERFVMIMRHRPGTTIIGARTAGIFSARSDCILPNGWAFSVSPELVRDADGICWEGLGLPPEVQVRNTLAAYTAGHDLALEAAISWLGGAPQP